MSELRVTRPAAAPGDVGPVTARERIVLLDILRGIAPLGVVIALLIFATQMAWSPWWLARFRFGPAEWLWRPLTYGHRQPMWIGQPVPVPVAVGPAK
jgi:uncharacterized membrane protein YeiB